MSPDDPPAYRSQAAPYSCAVPFGEARLAAAIEAAPVDVPVAALPAAESAAVSADRAVAFVRSSGQLIQAENTQRLYDHYGIPQMQPRRVELSSLKLAHSLKPRQILQRIDIGCKRWIVEQYRAARLSSQQALPAFIPCKRRQLTKIRSRPNHRVSLRPIRQHRMSRPLPPIRLKRTNQRLDHPRR